MWVLLVAILFANGEIAALQYEKQFHKADACYEKLDSLLLNMAAEEEVKQAAGACVKLGE